MEIFSGVGCIAGSFSFMANSGGFFKVDGCTAQTDSIALQGRTGDRACLGDIWNDRSRHVVRRHVVHSPVVWGSVHDDVVSPWPYCSGCHMMCTVEETIAKRRISPPLRALQRLCCIASVVPLAFCYGEAYPVIPSGSWLNLDIKGVSNSHSATGSGPGSNLETLLPPDSSF